MGNAAIATDANQYAGHAYVYGGAPGVNGKRPWDCSSFVNWVIGHDLGGAIPTYGSGQYTGSSHGPNTVEWLSWSGCTRISRASVSAGDLLIWPGHMGIAVSNSQMISALNPSLGTLVGGIDGAAVGPLTCKTYSSPLGTSSPTGSATGTTAILDSFPGGAFDPLNYPSYAGRAVGGAAGAAAAGIGTGIESAIEGIFGNIMKSLGFTSGKDFLIRISLIIMGVIILIIGIKSLANGTGSFISGGSGSSGSSETSSDNGDLFSALSDDDETASSNDGNSSSGGNLAGRSRPSSAANRSRQTPMRRSAVGSSSAKSGAAKATKYGPEKAIGKKAVEAAALA